MHQKFAEWFGDNILFAVAPVFLRLLLTWILNPSTPNSLEIVPDLVFMSAVAGITASGSAAGVAELLEKDKAKARFSGLQRDLNVGVFIAIAIYGCYMGLSITHSSATENGNLRMLHACWILSVLFLMFTIYSQRCVRDFKKE